ncbi:MAG: threonine synthase, partial [Elusimicrobia bacterium]|nr:threonine synthase [Elusimicrobiota bacterium]
MRHVLGLRCLACAAQNPADAVPGVCPVCGSNQEVVYDYAAIRRSLTRRALSRCGEPSLWRYRASLPVGASAAVPQARPGWTPLYRAPRLARE